MTATAGPRPAATRWPWIASVALAVAILAIVAFAVRTLVVAPASASAPETPAAPAAVAPPSAAPAPAPTPVVTGEPAVTDTAGRALPDETTVGVRGLYAALGTGDLAGLEARYAPDTDLDAAPWTEVAPLLGDPAARDQLLAALREDPQLRAGLYRYSADGARVGVDDQGRMAFLVLP